LENRKIKILEPNKGKHIAIVGDINTILAFKEDTGGTIALLKLRFFLAEGLSHTSKHVNMKGFTWLKDK
jgi:hypothetical protein